MEEDSGKVSNLQDVNHAYAKDAANKALNDSVGRGRRGGDGADLLVDRPMYLDRIMPFVDRQDIVKVLVGFRRSGKSELLRLIQRRLVEEGCNADQFIALNFEDYSLTPLHDPDKLYSYLLRRIESVDGRPYIFLDEVQEVDHFEKVVNSLRASTDADVYITGSNSTLLSGELATYLAGRYVEFTVYPFGYTEFCAARRMCGGGTSFSDFLEIGGMPFAAVQELDAASRQAYLTDIYRSVVLKDIVNRHRVRNVALLERIIAFAMQGVGNMVSANSIASFLKSEHISVGVQTVINDLEYCREAFLLEPVGRVDLKGKEMLRTMQKYYVADHGLRGAVVNDGMRQLQGLLENAVALEGLRRGYQVCVGTAEGHEVDFVFTKSGARRYVQVTYLMADEKTEEREFGAFKAIHDNYPKTVVSLDPVLRPRQGIEHRHIDEFLLATDW